VTLESPLRQLHENGGAKLATWFGTLLPDRFRSFEAEYRFARETVALADKNYRAFLFLTGPDRVRYLNAVVTGNIQDLAPGQGTLGLLLNPQGHILAELETYAFDDRLLVVSYAMIRAPLLATLDKFIIMDDATLEDTTDRFAVFSLEGPAAPAAVRELCGIELDALPELGHLETSVAALPCRLIRRFPGGIPGAEFLAERNAAEPLWQALLRAAEKHQGGPIGYAALNSLRLEAGIPWFGYDFDERVIPHEAALETSHISYIKGCYTGQEIVERVRSRGHVNRRRVGLAFSGRDAPAAGTELLAGGQPRSMSGRRLEAEPRNMERGQPAGHVTRAAFSPALGRAIGMGYLRREHTATGTKLDCAGATAEVIELPIANLRAARVNPAP
jgi:aminomethyltransferase